MARPRFAPARVAHAGFALLVAFALVALWMLAQTAFVRFALDQAAKASDGRFSAQGVEGTLFDGVWIRSLAWDDPAPGGVSVRVDELRINWWPLALLDRELDFARLHARAVTVRTRPSAEAAKLPGSLELPIALRLRDLRVATLRVEQQGAAPVELSGVELAARYAPGRYRIERLRVDSQWGELQLFGELADRAPFAVSAGAMAELRWGGPGGAATGGTATVSAARALSAAAAIDGALDDLQVSVAATVPGRAGDAGAPVGLLSARFRVAPLAAQPLGPIELALEDVDPAGLGLAPGLAMRLSGTSEVVLRLAGGAQGFGASGRAELRNAVVGSAARGGLPLRSVRGAFRWADGSLELSGLGAVLAGDGRARGRVRVDTTRTVDIVGRAIPVLALELDVDGLDLAAVLGAPQPTRLAGRVALQGARFDVDLSDGVRGGAALSASGEILAGRLELASARLRALPGLGDATLEASGTVALAAPYAARLGGRFASLDPARVAGAVDALAPELAASLADAREVLGRLPGRIEGRWSLEGALAAEPASLKLSLAVDSGRLAGHAVSLDAQATIAARRFEGMRARVDFGATRVRAEGALGAPGDRLRLTLRAPRIAELAALLGRPGIAGSLQASGEVRGRFEAPAIELEASGAALQIPGLGTLGGFELSARLPDLSDPLRARVEVKGSAKQLRAGEELVRSLQFEVSGNAGAHAIRAAVDAERGELRLAGTGSIHPSASGSYLEGARWRATLDELSVRAGKFDAKIVAPVQVEAARDAFEAGATVIESAHGRVRVARAAWRDGRFALEAEASVPSLGPPARAFGVEPPETGLDTGLDDVALELSVKLGGSGLDDLDGTLVATLASPPRVGASGAADLTIRNATLSGTLRVDLPSLAFARKLVGPEWLFDGRLRFSGSVAGSVRAPRLAGALSGEGLRLEQRALGWRLGEGTLAGRFDGERFVLDSLKLASRARGGGSVELRGEVLAATLDGRFDFVADRLVVPIGPGQRVVLSGDASATSEGGRFEIRGKLRADEGQIEIGSGDVPGLPADVVIKGDAPGAATARAQGGAAKLRIGAEVSLDLGRNLRVRGNGVDAKLGGQVTLRGSLPDAPRAFGTVTVVGGRYRAYGQQLDITRGRVIFNGALDNPVLDIVALRRDQPVEAGVAVTGTVLSPQVRLTSEPDVPDSEKLSWLVLGVPLEDAQSGAQGAALRAAAATLLGSNDGGLSGGLADALGLDVLTVRSASPGAEGFAPSGFGASSAIPGQIGGGAVAGASASENVVAVGKRLGSRVFLTYEQGLRGAWNLLRIQYDITRRLSLRAQTGSESALDLLYRYPFD